MARFLRYLLLAAMTIPASAATRLSVQELQTLIESAVQAGRSDEEIARRLSGVELKERLTENRAGFFPPTMGAKTQASLQLLAYTSALLPPPAAEAPPDAAPNAAAQGSILDRARAYASEYARRLPNFLCTATTRHFDDDASFRGPEI